MKTCRVPALFRVTAARVLRGTARPHALLRQAVRSLVASRPAGRFLTRAAALVAFALFFAVSCGSSDGTGEEVRSTVPKNGETGVDPRSIIAIHLSDIMTSVDDNLEPGLIRVTGDLTEGDYQGTISVAKWSSDILPGMTVEEFSPVGATPGEGEQPELDALVFLLADGASFKEGETITVKVSEDVTARGRSLNSSKRFHFVIVESGMETEALRVTRTNPRPGARGVGLSAMVRASFNRSEQLTGLDTGLTLRGEHSGVHRDVDSLYTHAAGFDVEISQRLAAGDSFLPGEIVEATWNRSLKDAGDVVLAPYLARFQVEAGLVNGGWDPTLASTDPLGGPPVAVLTADFFPETAGVEFVVVTEGSLELYRQSIENVWTSIGISILDRRGMDVVDAGLIDLDRDGVYEIVVLLAGESAGRLLTFELDDDGDLTRQPHEAEVLAGGATGFRVADIDASGDPELLVLHPRSGSLGSLTVFERKEFAPDPDAIDPLDPSTLLPRPGLGRVDNPVPGFKAATRVEAVDLSGDGRPDLVAQTASGGIAVYRNIGSSSSPYAFRFESDLRGRGSALQPLAWTVADVDSDFDADIVVWDSAGALVFRNKQSTVSGLTVQGSDLLSRKDAPEAFPSLDVSLPGPSLVRALEFDGDPFLDFVLARPSGAITLLLGATQDGTSFERLELDGVGNIPVDLAIADVSGDSGQDLVLFETGSRLPAIHLSQNVDAPARPAPNEFRIALESRSGADDLLFVRAEGDFKERFAGYSLALDYDQSLLTYVRFEVPEDLESLANFTFCPDAAGDGCEGGVSARMAYRSEVTSGLPQDGVVLGWFVFRLPTVTEDTTTTVQLAEFEDGGKTFENTVSVLESGARFEVPATLPAEPLTVLISSPSPDELVASCSVVTRRASDMDVRLSWNSPAGVSFSEFVVSAGGSQVLTSPGSATEVQFSTTLTGIVSLEVQGRTADGDVFSASCDVIGVHRPEVHCEVVSLEENRITWSLSHSADSFRIYRNGAIINTVVGTIRQFRDQSPSPDGADLYEVDAVVSGTMGPRGACLEGPIGDPDSDFTQPPRNVTAVLRTKNSSNDPNEIRLSWENGEGYTSLFVALRLASGGGAPMEIQISGTATQYVFSGDETLGGVSPNEYVASVRGVVGALSSVAISSDVVAVGVPPLATRLACSVVDDGDIRMTWDRVWQGYTDLQVSIEHRIDGVLQGTFVQSISLETTEFVYTPPVPLGTYRVQLVATYLDPLLPAALLPRPELMRRSCDVVDFDTRVLLGGADVGGARRIETGVGIPRVEIPVRAKVLATLIGFEFALEYPDFLTSGDPLELELEHLGATSTMTVTPLGNGRERVEVTVTGVRVLPDQDGDGAADGEVPLATLVGGVPPDFSLAGEYPVGFAGATTLTFAAAPGEAANPTEVDADDGSLRVVSSYVLAEVVEIPAGSRDVIPLAVFGTFPEWAPDYRLNSFVLHLRFDPDELEFVETRQSDQSGSAVFGRGAFFLPSAEARARANETGEVTIPWVGFDLQNLAAGFVFLEPGILLRLATFNFRSKLPADTPTVFSSIQFVHGKGTHNPTAFLPEFDVPGSPDLEGFFGGGVRVVSDIPELSLASLDPATGALAGGTRATLRGTGFARLDREDISLSLVMGDEPGAIHLPVPPGDIISLTASEIVFAVPDSGLRPVTGTPASFSADVVLDIDPDGRLALPGAYAYEYPVLTGADRNSGRADAFQVMVLQGFGLPPDSRVRFVFDDEAIEASINSVAANGRSLQLTIPDLQGHEGELATIELTVPFLNDLALRLVDFFSVLGGGPTPELSLVEVLPPAGTICGGYEVTVKGEEFRPSLQVFFGDEEGIGVVVDDATTARVIVPSVPEGTASVQVRVVDGAMEDSLDGAFAFEHPAPPFRRGDVNDDGQISVLDIVRLSDLLVGGSVAFPPNLDAADTNDDAIIDGGDVTKLTNALFGDRVPLPDPFIEPGLDPTPDSLTSCPGTF